MKINLDNILENVIIERSNNSNSFNTSSDIQSELNFNMAKEAMLEFGKQLLELAAENGVNNDYLMNKESITNTIKQVE